MSSYMWPLSSLLLYFSSYGRVTVTRTAVIVDSVVVYVFLRLCHLSC